MENLINKYNNVILCRRHHNFVICTGDVTIPDGMTLTVNSDLNGASPQFTFTCISTGGPATTVTWTRDSATAMGDAVTAFNDVTTATYTHTLTVTGRLGGLYQCNVSNSKPSHAVASLTMNGKKLYTNQFNLKL